MRSYLKTLGSVGPRVLENLHRFVVTALRVGLALAIWVFSSTDNTADWAIRINELPREAYVFAGLVFLIIAEFLVIHAVRKQRDALKKVWDIERTLDLMGMHFDEGTQLLNAPVRDGNELTEWVTLWDRWRGNVEDTLSKNFGIREQMLFHNSVLVTYHGLSGFNPTHVNGREQLVRKLELLSATIIRHCDHAARKRQEIE